MYVYIYIYLYISMDGDMSIHIHIPILSHLLGEAIILHRISHGFSSKKTTMRLPLVDRMTMCPTSMNWWPRWIAIRRRSFDDLGFFSQWEIHSKHGESCRESVLFFGDGESRINHNVLFFCGGFLKQVSKFCRFKHPSVLAAEAHNLGGCKTNELVINWWSARVMFLWSNFVVQKCYPHFQPNLKWILTFLAVQDLTFNLFSM